jgi:alpha-amylase
MCTKFFADGEVHKYFNPYQTAYEAFINYMNVLADFTLRLDRVVPINQYEQKISMLENLLAEKDGKIKQIEAENQKLAKRKKSKKKMF